MSKHKGAHHRGPHDAIAERMSATAKANPDTRCSSCGNTLDKCGPRGDGRNRNGTQCTWDAGHVVPGDSRFGYCHQCSHCNRSEGAAAGNIKRTGEPREPWP